MKKILLLSIIIITCISCRYEERGNLTKKGKAIFDTWQSGSELVMDNVVRSVFLVNAWINSDSAGKIAIEDLYFPEMKVRQYGTDMFRIMDGARPIITITTNGQNSLGEAGTCWEIVDQVEYTSVGAWMPEAYPIFAFKNNSKLLTITNTGDNHFSIVCDSVSYLGSSTNWELAFPAGEIPTDIYTSAFEMSGDGRFDFPASGNASFNDGIKEVVRLRYHFAQPLMHHESPELAWESGKIELTASMNGKEDITVIAEIAGREGVDITYKGITERWYW